MIGTIAGDMIGSYWEFRTIKGYNLPLFVPDSTFTDDSILSCAISNAILVDGDYKRAIVEFAKNNCDQDTNGLGTVGPGFGSHFIIWIMDSEDHEPYNSYGNGSAMRAGPIGWAFDTLEETLAEATKQSCVSHDHPSAVTAAKAVAATIFLIRKGESVEFVKEYLMEEFDYFVDWDKKTFEYYNRTYEFNVYAGDSVPEAIACALNAKNYEDAIRKVLYIGGDTDTLGAIAGSIAEALFGVPNHICEEVESRMSEYAPHLLKDVHEFEKKYGSNRLSINPGSILKKIGISRFPFKVKTNPSVR